ncbi:MAG: amidohydrolase family protein [Gemmatimonadales bacterium]
MGFAADLLEAGRAAAGGGGLLEELDEFREAGIPADDILRIATAGAADFLDVGDTWGRIGVGYRAALLVLESDPRELSSLRRPAAALHQGRLIDAATLAAWREGRSP